MYQPNTGAPSNNPLLVKPIATRRKPQLSEELLAENRRLKAQLQERRRTKELARQQHLDGNSVGSRGGGGGDRGAVEASSAAPTGSPPRPPPKAPGIVSSLEARRIIVRCSGFLTINQNFVLEESVIGNHYCCLNPQY
jgi:hypothetical protein